MRTLHAKKPTALPPRPAALSLPGMDARPDTPIAPDAEPMVADPEIPRYPEIRDAAGNVLPRSVATCQYCGGKFDRGDPAGSNLTAAETAHLSRPTDDKPFVWYPKAEYAYWRHCTTARHQATLNAIHASITQHLAALPAALATAKTAQKELRDPARKALKRILA